MVKVVIDGNIGSGKTTQLNFLEKKGWHVKREPIDEWPLDLFYKDKSRWALLLQLKILQTLRPVKGTVVYERCLLSTRHVFWEYLVQKKLVTPEENDVYCTQYDKDAWYPDVYIFLSKTPELAFEHVQKRGQTGDFGVTLEYLKDLEGLYKQMIRNVPCKVHIVNAEQPPEAIHEQILSLLRVDGVHVSDTRGEKVSSSSAHKRQMLCTPFTNMCSVS